MKQDALRASRSEAEARPGAVDLDALADLEEQRRFLLQSLRDLDRERDAGDLDEDDYRTLKDDYTVRAAAVLRAIEDNRTGLRQARDRRPRPSVKLTALVLAGVVAVAVLAGVLVAGSSGERLPGRTSSGSVSTANRDRLAQAQSLFGQSKWPEALGVYAKVLHDDPRNLEALTYGGWSLAQLGQVDSAQRSLDRALAVDANFPPAHLFRGLLLLDARNDPKGAIPELQAFLAANPPAGMVPVIQGRLQEAQAKAGQAR